jgi:NAD(P)-dependent dehydrogenase (short-subunit alcohol dehydrogenase family)
MAELVLVSGGSGGIGAATCRHLATKGVTPIVGYASGQDRAKSIAEETGGTALALDLSDNDVIDHAVEWLASSEHPLTTCILAASPPPVIGPFGKIDDEDMMRQWKVNVFGPRRLVAGLVKSCFRKRKQGTVIAVLTEAMGISNGMASPGMGAYVIAKYGLMGVLATANAEYPWLTATTISPGFTETEMLTAFDERFLEITRNQQPDGRFTSPEEVARNIVSLVSTIS